MDLLCGEDVVADRRHDRIEQPGRLADPVAQCSAIESRPLANIDLTLTKQRKVVTANLRHQQMGERARCAAWGLRRVAERRAKQSQRSPHRGAGCRQDWIAKCLWLVRAHGARRVSSSPRRRTDRYDLLQYNCVVIASIAMPGIAFVALYRPRWMPLMLIIAIAISFTVEHSPYEICLYFMDFVVGAALAMHRLPTITSAWLVPVCLVILSVTLLFPLSIHQPDCAYHRDFLFRADHQRVDQHADSLVAALGS